MRTSRIIAHDGRRAPRVAGSVSDMAVRVGVGLFTGQIPEGTPRTFAQEYRDTIELVRLTEALGFDSVWVSEHHGASDGYLPSLLPMLAAFAATTEHIRLGTGIVLTPFHDPIRLAEDAAVVDQLSNGRLILGLGIGWREEEFRMFDVPMAERLQRTVETIEVLRRAWTSRRFSFRGRAFRYDRVRVTPPPVRDGGPPIYLGGYAESAVRRAGRLGDGYITDADPIKDVVPAVELFESAAREAGKDPRTMGLVLLQNVVVSRDGSGWNDAGGGIAHQLGAYAAWEAGSDTPDVDRLELPPPDEEAILEWTTAGTPSEVATRLRVIARTFADRDDLEIVARLHYPGMTLEQGSTMLEVFAEDVLPALRGD
jgi:probable F420-dependent oxidoreductase